MEVLIQAFYSVFHHNVDSIVHCLTDLTVWHYCKFLRRDEHLDIEWSHTIIDTWHPRPTVKKFVKDIIALGVILYLSACNVLKAIPSIS